MSPADAEDLLKAIADPTIYGSTIAEVVRSKRSIQLSGFSVQRHRRGICSCAKL